MKKLSLFVSLLGLAAQLLCQDARRPLSIDDFSRFEDISDPQVSPDGAWILYTLSVADPLGDKRQTDIWMVSWDGSKHLRITSDSDNETSPRWSPDGKYISFLSSRPGGKAKGSQVWLLDRSGGEAQQLTELKSRISGYVWSPDSKRLAIVTREGEDPEKDPSKTTSSQPAATPIVINRYHFKQDIQGYLQGNTPSRIFLYDIASRKAEPLTPKNDHDQENPAWSPDGLKIAFVSDLEKDVDRTHNTDVFVADAIPGSKAVQLTTARGSDGGHLAWSPDSSSIAYVEGTDQAKYSFHSLNRLGVVDVNGNNPNILTTALDRGVSSPVFSEDGKSILFLVADDRTEYLARIPANGGPVERAIAGPRVVLSQSTSAGHTVLLLSTDSEPPQLYALESGELRKLTTHNDEFLSGIRLAKTEDISFRSKDGSEVHGLLTKPVDYVEGRRYPTLVRIHGGPTAQDAHSFQFERQLFAANGYVVLSVNYRGSTGRGEAYSRAIFQDWGHKDVEDVLAATDYVIAAGIADPERLGIGGWSYGGVLTDYTIAHDTRFKAAISGAGSANHISLYGVDQYTFLYDNEFGPPWKNPELWIKFSFPFFHADRIQTPTLFMGGEKDFNVPIIGSEQMYQALQTLNVPTELVIYPGQNHGLSKQAFIRDRYERYLAWYDKYLKSEERTSSAAVQ